MMTTSFLSLTIILYVILHSVFTEYIIMLRISLNSLCLILKHFSSPVGENHKQPSILHSKQSVILKPTIGSLGGHCLCVPLRRGTRSNSFLCFQHKIECLAHFLLIKHWKKSSSSHPHGTQQRNISSPEEPCYVCALSNSKLKL